MAVKDELIAPFDLCDTKLIPVDGGCDIYSVFRCRRLGRSEEGLSMRLLSPVW